MFKKFFYLIYDWFNLKIMGDWFTPYFRRLESLKLDDPKNFEEIADIYYELGNKSWDRMQKASNDYYLVEWYQTLTECYYHLETIFREKINNEYKIIK